MKASYEGGQMPMFRRLPKRGFRNGPFRETFIVVNVGELDGKFAAGSSVGTAELRAAGLVRGPHDMPVKVLGEGELKAALTVKVNAFSKSAIEKIQKAGGTAEWLGGAPKKPAPDFAKLDAERKEKAAAAKGKGKEQKEPKAGGQAPEAKASGEGAAKPAEGKAPKAPKPPKPPKAEGGQAEGGTGSEGGKPAKEAGAKAAPKQPKGDAGGAGEAKPS
jgi:ribosomal protein L15